VDDVICQLEGCITEAEHWDQFKQNIDKTEVNAWTGPRIQQAADYEHLRWHLKTNAYVH